jgi:hypothetical protein
MSLRDDIRDLADDVLAKGGDEEEVRLAVFARFNLVIGQGGQGSPQYAQDYPKCRYCGALLLRQPRLREEHRAHRHRRPVPPLPHLQEILEDMSLPGQRPGTLPGCVRTVGMLLIALIAVITGAGLVFAIYLERDDE